MQFLGDLFRQRNTGNDVWTFQAKRLQREGRDQVRRWAFPFVEGDLELHVAEASLHHTAKLFLKEENPDSEPAHEGWALRPLLGDASASKVVEILEQDFLDHDAVGPRRVAEFLTGRPDDAVQADVVGFVGELLGLLREG